MKTIVTLTFCLLAVCVSVRAQQISREAVTDKSAQPDVMKAIFSDHGAVKASPLIYVSKPPEALANSPQAVLDLIFKKAPGAPGAAPAAMPQTVRPEQEQLSSSKPTEVVAQENLRLTESNKPRIMAAPSQDGAKSIKP